MSQYFSRLATRSGVATTSRALQPRPTRSDEASSWSEQSTEVIAQPSTSAADSNANFDSPITHSVGIHRENISVNTVLEMQFPNHQILRPASPLPIFIRHSIRLDHYRAQPP